VEEVMEELGGQHLPFYLLLEPLIQVVGVVGLEEMGLYLDQEQQVVQA
jgi:hypothetical protein